MRLRKRPTVRLQPRVLRSAVSCDPAVEGAQDREDGAITKTTRRRVSGSGNSGTAKDCPSEHAEQVAFVKWFRLQYPKVLIFAIPNGGARHIVAAKKLKDEGVVSGVADLYVPKWRLWIEMKRAKGGALSPEQKKFCEYVTQVCGDNWIIARGAERGRELVRMIVP